MEVRGTVQSVQGQPEKVFPFTSPSRLFRCQLHSFGDIGQRDVCLLSNIIELEGTGIMVLIRCPLKSPQNIWKSQQQLFSFIQTTPATISTPQKFGCIYSWKRLSCCDSAIYLASLIFLSRCTIRSILHGDTVRGGNLVVQAPQVGC